MTGASGFIGARIAYELRISHTPISLGRSESHDFPTFDLSHPTSLRKSLNQVHADVIIHAGAMARRQQCDTNPALAHTVNVEATMEISSWAATHDIPMIFLSTVGVNEDNAYTTTKRMAEECVQISGAKACIMRLAYTFGWSPSPSRPKPQFKLEAEAIRPGSQEFDNSWQFQPTSLAHVCEVLGAVLARRDDFPLMLNVVAPQSTTMHGLASASLAHKIRENDELRGRVPQHLDPTALVSMGLPVITIESLFEEIRAFIKGSRHTA